MSMIVIRYFGYFKVHLSSRSLQLVSDGTSGLPSLLYKSVIVAGARQNGLPQNYIDFLTSVMDNGFEGHKNIEWLNPIYRAIHQFNGGFARCQ